MRRLQMGAGRGLWPCFAVRVDPSKVDIELLPQKRLLRKTIAREIESRIRAHGVSALQEVIVRLRLDD